jgi:hypothetical protein
MKRQQEAGKAQKAEFQDAMQKYQNAFDTEVATGKDPFAATVAATTKNASVYHTLIAGGFDPAAHIKDMIAMQKGQVVPAGGALVDPTTGQSKFVNPNKPITAHDTPIGADASGNLVVSPPGGGAKTMPGVQPLNMGPAQLRSDAGDNKPLHFKDANNNVVISTPGQLKQILQNSGGDQPVTMPNGPEKVVGLPPGPAGRALQYAPQLYHALSDLHDLDQTNGITGPFLGKIKTAVGGKLLGTNDAAVLYGAAKEDAQRAIAASNTGGGQAHGALKTTLDTLPSDFHDTAYNTMGLGRYLDSHRSATQAAVDSAEAKGAFGGSIPDNFLTMGVTTKATLPLVQKLQSDPAALTSQEFTRLATGVSKLPPNDPLFQAAAQEVTRRIRAGGGQATGQSVVMPPAPPRPQQQQPQQQSPVTPQVQ